MSKKGPAIVVTVVEWATIVRPVGRFPWVAYLLPALALGVVSAFGAYSALSSPDGGGLWIVFWLGLGVIPMVGALGFLSRRLVTVRDKAREKADRSAALPTYLFSSSAIGMNISSWRDWKRGDEKGPGFLRLEGSALLVFTADDGVLRRYAWGLRRPQLSAARRGRGERADPVKTTPAERTSFPDGRAVPLHPRVA